MSRRINLSENCYSQSRLNTSLPSPSSSPHTIGKYLRSLFALRSNSVRQCTEINDVPSNKDLKKLEQINSISMPIYIPATSRRRSLSETDVLSASSKSLLRNSQSPTNKWIHRLGASFRKKVLRRPMLMRQHTINVNMFDHYLVSKWMVETFILSPIKNRLLRVRIM